MTISMQRWVQAAVATALAVSSLSCGGDSGSSPSPTPTNVVVAPGADTLISVGENQTFTATVLDANGDPIDGATVTWSSDAPAVVSVNATSGVATAVANGSAHVKATVGAIEGSANVIVTQIVTSVTVTPGNVAFTSVGDTARFTAVAKDAGGTVVPGVQILWTVSDNTVATIDTLGLARSKGPGAALVSAQAQTRAGYAAIGVAPGVASIAILGSPTTATAGDPIATALVVELRDANGNRVVNASLPITVTPAGVATGTPLHGTTTTVTDAGRATFTALWFEQAGPARFKVAVTGVPSDSSAPITVAPAAVAKVRLDPVGAVATAGVALPLIARVFDRFDNQAINFNGPVKAQLIPGGGPGSFFGDSIVTAAGGVATFETLNFHLAAGPYRLTAFLPGVATERDTTGSFSVQAGPPSALTVDHVGPVYAPFARGGDSTSVHLADAFGNPATDDELTVAVEMIEWNGVEPPVYMNHLTSEATAPVVGGEAVFNIGVSRPGRVTLVFSAFGLAPDTAEAIPTKLGFLTFVGATDAAACFSPAFCSGNNALGQLGVDPGVLSETSFFVGPDSGFGGNVFYLDGGAGHFCAVVEEFGVGQRVVCWGDNSDGQLGNGSVGGSTPLHQFGALHVSVGGISAGKAHTCAILDGVTECWGRNDAGQLGTGAAGASTGTPGTVSGGHTFYKVSAGGGHTCAIDGGDNLWCWGANNFGQLGDSGVAGAFSADPVQVHSSRTFIDVAAGEDFTCASATPEGPLRAAVFCWGRNDAGQLGAPGAGAMSLVPVQVFDALNLSSGSVVAGAKFACATSYDTDFVYRTMCWGANDHGQLGRGTATPFEGTPLPTLAADNSRVGGFMAAGAEYVCGGNLEPGTRWICWGRNDHGQFGGGGAGDISYPTIIEDGY